MTGGMALDGAGLVQLTSAHLIVGNVYLALTDLSAESRAPAILSSSRDHHRNHLSM